MHRHLEVRIDAGRPVLVAHGVSSKLRWHANVLCAPDENLGVGDVQAHLEVCAHDGLGNFQLQRGGACHRIRINIRIVRSGDDAVCARRRSDDEVIEVEANPLARTECLHAFVRFAYFVERRGTGFDKGDDAGLVHGGIEFRVKKESMQVDLDLVTMLELLESCAQVPQPEVAPRVAGVEPHVDTHGASSRLIWKTPEPFGPGAFRARRGT